MSEYGEAGQGSAPPWELMWKNPLPAAKQPPDSFSSPGNVKKSISSYLSRRMFIFLNNASLSLSLGASSTVVSSTGTYSMKNTTLQPKSYSSSMILSSIIVSMFPFVNVSEAPNIKSFSLIISIELVRIL